MDQAAVVDLSSSLLAFFGNRYFVLTLPVTLHQIALRIGDVVNVVVPQLPWMVRAD